MMRKLVVVALLFAGTAAAAQSPYAGMQARDLKALSEAQIADLKAGRGMGFALPAELNGYPGPVHVLELADKLGLSDEQRAEIQTLFATMTKEATELGVRLLEQEADLDRQFANQTVTPESLRSTTAAAAVIQGALRETHLRYHLSTKAILTAGQVQKYAELRGYAASDHRPSHRH